MASQLPTAPLDDPEWPKRVALRFNELQRTDTLADQAIRRMLLLKQAIREVSITMGRQMRHDAAKTKEDKLGWTMTFLRAAEEVRLKTMEKCALAYPYLTGLVKHQNPNIRANGGLDGVREHAVELARGSVTEDLAALEKSDMETFAWSQRKEHILARLRRLIPGASTSLSAMKDAAGNITADPEEMADILRAHWGSVFTKQNIDKQLLEKWISNATLRDDGDRLPPTSAPEWKVTREEIELAVKQSGDGMPGPDRIPYKAWRKLGTLAVDILHGAIEGLASDGANELLRQAYYTGSGTDASGHDFNLGILCCLPKKVTGIDEELGEYYDASATRPLSLVNTDNRILASAARIRWKPIFNSWVSKLQRGFLRGRSMISNFVDVDYEAMTVSLKHKDGSLILFDIRAAFPSMSHEYMFEVLRRIGMPLEAFSFVQALYDENKCFFFS